MKKIVLTLVISLLVGLSNAKSQSVYDTMLNLLDEHPSIHSAFAKYESQHEKYLSTKKEYYPTVGAGLNGGLENYRLSSPDGGNTKKSNLTVSEIYGYVKQPIVDISKLKLTQATKKLRDALYNEYEQVRQDILLDGLEAYVQLQKSYDQLKIAWKSVENVQKQTELENTRLDRGRGYTTDLLQAKRQLLGAQARKSRSEADVNIALNNYYNIFNKAPSSTSLVNLSIPSVAIPTDIENAVTTALQESPSLNGVKLRLESIQLENKTTFAAQYFPKADLDLRFSSRNNFDGSKTTTQSMRALVAISYQIGFSSTHKIKSSMHKIKEISEQYAALKRQKEKLARDNWILYNVSQKNFSLLQDQVNIAEEFLYLARQERELGRRSLLDVLNGETALYNAQLNLLGAKHEYTLSAYRLLHALGTMNIGVIEIEEL